MNTELLKNLIQDCHLNFLIGSGLSAPYLSTVGNTETLLTDLSKNDSLENWQNDIIRASILGNFFESVILKNLKIIDYSKPDPAAEAILEQYKIFLKALNTILIRRKSSLLSKQVNLFTTNVDLFIERALEDTQMEFNDGFSGRMRPVFSLTNFKQSLIKRSAHYDNAFEMPLFNILKVHGSLTWKSEKDKIVYSDLTQIMAVEVKWKVIAPMSIKFNNTDLFLHFENEVKKYSKNSNFIQFLNEYQQFAIVNPTKEKFQDTILNLNYYELLRIFSNELEKENTLLMVLGFSIADEHIREIIVRAANSNPTLLIIVYAFDDSAKIVIESNIEKCNVPRKNDNIKVIAPDPGECFDFKTINEKIFVDLLHKIGK